MPSKDSDGVFNTIDVAYNNVKDLPKSTNVEKIISAKFNNFLFII